MYKLPEFIPDGLEIPNLDQLGRQLANEVTRIGKKVAEYEVDVASKTKAHKLAMAAAKVLFKDSKYTPTMINAMAESSDDVKTAADALQQAEALLLIGKAECEGRDKQYQMVKKIIELKVQELRVFRG